MKYLILLWIISLFMWIRYNMLYLSTQKERCGSEGIFFNNFSRICSVTPENGQKNPLDGSRCSNQNFLLSGGCTRKVHHSIRIETWRFKRMWMSHAYVQHLFPSEFVRVINWNGNGIKEVSHSCEKFEDLFSWISYFQLYHCII